MQNKKLLHFDCINSTNTYSIEHFDDLEDKTVVSADKQTAGRGRFDRKWISESEENIYVSFVLKPENKNHLTNLTQYLCVVCAKILENYNVQPEIKWPNDVLVNGKKICGILCETKLKQNKIQGVVLGIGINLNMPDELIKTIDRPATSLNLETKQKIDKQKFFNTLVEMFFENYEDAAEKGFSSFKEDYLKRIHFLGKKIFIQQRDNAQKLPFLAKTIDNNGNLIVLDDKKEEKTVYSGDLIL